MRHDFALDLGAGVRRCVYCWAVEAFARPLECPERADKARSGARMRPDTSLARRKHKARVNPA